MEPDRGFDSTRTKIDHPEDEGGPIDFSQCRRLEDVLLEVKRMGFRKETLPTSDGRVRFTAPQLAKNIETAVRLALAATRDPKEPFVTQRVSPDRLDDIFAQSAITSTAGLREAMVRVMGRTSKTGEEFHRLISEIRQEGEFNPVNKLSLEEFQRQYPREGVPLEVTKGMDDTQGQVVRRWQLAERGKIQAVEQQKVQRLREWQDERSRVGFHQEWITPPTSSDGYAQYGKAQEANKVKREAKEAEARRRQFARMEEGGADQNSIAADIALMLGADKARFSYQGVNWSRGGRGMPEPKMTRTYSLPIDGAPGHIVTVTLFSEAQVPDNGVIRELPENFQGVMVEAVDRLPAYSGAKAETAEQRRIVELARAQLQRIEGQVRSKYGIDLGIEKKLATLVQ